METEIKEAEGSMVSKLWSGLIPTFSRPGENTERTITAMTWHRVYNITYLFTLHNDKKLRVWSLEKLACIDVKPVTPEVWDTRNAASQGKESKFENSEKIL